MTDKLHNIGFQQSQADKCVFYCDDIIFIVYIDDALCFGNYDGTMMLIIRQLKKAGLNIKDQGHPADYVGVNIKKSCDGTYQFIQRSLIDVMIDNMDIGNSYTEPIQLKCHSSYTQLAIHKNSMEL
ncbi:hypothetical protein ACHAW6_002257 [Cyclotella cf. meneghiniana]